MKPLSPAGSIDPDPHVLTKTRFVYPEAGTFVGDVKLSTASGNTTHLVVPAPDAKSPKPATIHIILQVQDDGRPALTTYRRAIITLKP